MTNKTLKDKRFWKDDSLYCSEEDLKTFLREISSFVDFKVKEMHKLMGGYVPSKATMITQHAQDIKLKINLLSGFTDAELRSDEIREDLK